DTELSPRDPAWIGAWWLGFLIIAIVLWIVAIPTAMFPKRLPSAPERQDAMVDEATRRLTRLSLDGADESTLVKILTTHPKALVDALLRLVRNKTYMLVVIATIFDLYVIACYFIFLPKYLEAQFNIPAYKASMYTGTIGMLSSCLGIVGGGYFMKRVKVQPKGGILMILTGCGIAIITLTILLFLGCDNTAFAGGRMTDDGYDLVMQTVVCRASCGPYELFTALRRRWNPQFSDILNVYEGASAPVSWLGDGANGVDAEVVGGSGGPGNVAGHNAFDPLGTDSQVLVDTGSDGVDGSGFSRSSLKTQAVKLGQVVGPQIGTGEVTVKPLVAGQARDRLGGFVFSNPVPRAPDVWFPLWFLSIFEHPELVGGPG
ncbi:PREDICTED: solute carrier organic anion transporter family member 5A1-like, partial [Priapulus caudatus]|uniref:Solute carrier organic anion transporter family member 5A1-like n=1 Tax=Priapulus caudatus TaxID=37621 RepID=A0ABM1F3N4_PRICU